MKKLILYILLIILFYSCKKENVVVIIKPIIKLNVNDTNYVVNKFYKKGDVRRYGIFPNKHFLQKRLDSIIILAKKGLPISFPKGYYKADIILEGVSNINFIFNDAIFCGKLYIIENNKHESQKINIDGKLTILDKLFIRKSNTISFDTLIIKTDTIKAISKKQNRGVSLYAGTKNVTFNLLKISNTGGTQDAYFKYTASALQIHGWKNNPENITIKNLEINNADRTGLYLTGNGHRIEKATITNFGLGNSKNMLGLEDAKPNEEKLFTGAWINKCNDCEIDTLQIKNNTNKGTYSLRLGEGKYHQPTFIYNVNIAGKDKYLPIKDNELTNILVKNEY